MISGLSNNPYFLIAGDLVSIFCICLICAYFALNIRKKGVNITKQIIAMAVGWIVLFSGGLLTSEEVVGLFATSTLLVQAFGYTLVFIGIVASTLGFWTLPSLNELEWRDQVKHLYLMVKSGIIIYDQSFRGERSLDSNLVAGGITGIASLIQEITSTAGKLEVIQQEGAKILIHPGVYITGVLVVEDDLSILHQKLAAFVTECETLFQYELPAWNGNIDIFASRPGYLRKIFLMHFIIKFHFFFFISSSLCLINSIKSCVE